jgi:hypothetical protein
MELQPLPLDRFPEAVRRHVDPASPAPFRLMGAKGLVPVGPAETLALLYQLSFDTDGPIRAAALDTMRGLPDDLLGAGLGSVTHGPVLAWIATERKLSATLLEIVLRNAATPDETVATIAGTCSESLTELIGENEVRVLRHPEIIESLYLNENARTSRIDRLLDLARRHKVRFEKLPALQALLEDERYDTAAAAAAAATAEDDRVKAHLADSRIEEAEREIEEKDMSEEQRTRRRVDEQEVEPERKKNRAAAILDMSISQKMRLATLGSAGDRDALIKESNRLVHMAAVTSPKVQLRDIVAWSSNKQLPDGVITYLANHTRYRRIYHVMVNLVNNPKTPLKEVVRLIPQLREKDLIALMRNRNVSGAVRRQAQALKEQRTNKR